MALPEDLLEQARHLATRDSRGRPKQHNLHRAVSAAYYALFHFLIDRACRSFLGGGPEARELRGVLGRAFEHAPMRKASNAFASGMLPARLQPGLGGGTVPPGVRAVANAFRRLREERHAADYDLLRRFEREQVLPLIEQAEDAIRTWNGVQNTLGGRLYLMALLVGERVRE